MGLWNFIKDAGKAIGIGGDIIAVSSKLHRRSMSSPTSFPAMDGARLPESLLLKLKLTMENSFSC